MRNSFYAAVLAAALPAATMAQAPAQSPEPGQNGDNCIQMSATFKFCADENANSYDINSPNTEPLLGIPGRLIENGGDINDNCALITTIERNPLFVVCADPQTPDPADP